MVAARTAPALPPGHPTLLYEALPQRKVRCTACARYCTIPEGSHGFCFVRANHAGKLELLTYGIVAAVQVDPVEKKPLSHYRPGTRVFGIGTHGCNWRCQYCQNFEISQDHGIEGRKLSPQEAVEWALRRECQGITFTYNEPTIFIEYAVDVIDEAHRHGLFANFVTNGYMTPEATDLLRGKLDAVSVDFKGSGEPGFMRKYIQAKGPEPILSSLEALAKNGTHVEVTNLIVPKVGDDPAALRKLAAWVRDHLGREVPFHLLRWHPDYKMMDLPETPIPTLEKLHAIAKEEGLDYVYLGNVWGHPLEHTYCPKCGSIAVDRYGFYIRSWNLDEQNRCKECLHPIPIVGHLPGEYEPTYVTPLM
ncbi:MAG: AmmeMemoRadiSam system radical SAM enzyme [Euryarchaeota archaeon]|nr:AmmeMemoRadiSam system radical SAM enzyme [Euryarchaeota archaeon]MDE1836360.1 AmmeMemoRadiSam system radical SAM enzyme [Euryarchaeota archaeon]MDE1879158.1 AmmeMemoRadiSam system radical SAM enzyme [Euryarchaeota archaeon]MDE2044244.1 AmmeMemoRadiSam system radical SAM enzyme [Thermoplasmata archaeon]